MTQMYPPKGGGQATLAVGVSRTPGDCVFSDSDIPRACQGLAVGGVSA